MKCEYDPRKTDHLVGVYECPKCGELVLSGEEHPDYSIIQAIESEDEEDERE